MPVYDPEGQGLPAQQCAPDERRRCGRPLRRRARIVGEPGVNIGDYAAVLREAVYNSRFRTFYSAEAYIGLEGDFMVKAHLHRAEES